MAERSALLLTAEAHARAGRVAEGVKACFEAIALDGTESRTHALLAHLLLEGDFYSEAISEATCAIECDQACSPAYLALGLAYDRHGGMWGQSVLVWHELAEVAPDFVAAHVQLGEAYAASAFEHEAVKSWEQALELDPKELRATYNLAIASLKHEGVAHALPLFRKAGELDPGQDELFHSLIDLNNVGKIGSAPMRGICETHRAAARLALKREDYFAVFDSVRCVLDENPDDPEALALAAYTYFKQEAMQEAAACALRALSLSPGCAAALYSLGCVYARKTGLNRHAARVFIELARHAPEQALVHLLLAESLFGLQRYRRAIEAYRTALGIDPACVRARFGLAAAYLIEDRYAEAQWQLRCAARYDTKRKGLFWRLYDDYAAVSVSEA